MTSLKDIEGLLAGIPPVQYLAVGSCGVKNGSKGMDGDHLFPTGKDRVHYSGI